MVDCTEKEQTGQLEADVHTVRKIYIRWAPRPDYGFLEIFRGDNPDGPFEYIGDVDLNNVGDVIYAPSKPWNLGVTAGSIATVFVKYRDGTGNKSVPAVADIKLVTLGSTPPNQNFLPVITQQ